MFRDRSLRGLLSRTRAVSLHWKTGVGQQAGEMDQREMPAVACGRDGFGEEHSGADQMS